MHLSCDEVMQLMHQNSPFLGFSYEQDEPFCNNTEMMPMVWLEGDLQALDPEMLAFPLVDPTQITVSEPPDFMKEKWPLEVEEKLSGNQVTMNSSSTSASSSFSTTSSSSSSSSASSVLEGYCMESEGHIHSQYSSSFQEIIMSNPPSHNHTSLTYAKQGNDVHQYTNLIHTSDNEKRKRDASESEDSYEDVVSRKLRQGRSTKRARAAETHNQSERNRRGRINEKLRALQELIPNANKTDKASLLTEVISYLKSLRLTLQVMSYRNAMWNTSSPRAAHQVHIPQMTHEMTTSDRTNFQPTMQVGCITNAPTHFSNGPAPKPFAFDEDPFRTIQHPAPENPTIFPSFIVR